MSLINPIKNRVSIIVPCYNQAQYLEECLESVLNQTYNNWECIIVNDGSTDNTEEIAIRWTNKDSRFKYIKKDNGGLSSARNAGFELSTGEFIQFLDCDDLIHHNKLFEQVNEFIRDKTLDISYTNFITFSGSLQNKLNRYAECFISDKPLNDFLFKWERGFSIPIHCALFKKDIWFDNLPFNTKLKSKEDWFMWVELMIKNAKISLLNKEYAFYRIHDKSMSRDEMSNINSLIHLSILISLNLNDQLREEYIKEKLKHILNTIKYNISIEKNIIKNSIRYRLGNFLIYPIYKIYKLIK